jgi:hypothetical protein
MDLLAYFWAHLLLYSGLSTHDFPVFPERRYADWPDLP